MQKSQTHVPSLLSALMFTLAGLFLLSIGLLMGFSALLSLAGGKQVESQQTILFIAFSFEGLLLFLAAFFSIQKMLQKPAADRATSFTISWWLILVAVLVAGGALLVGDRILDVEPANWLILPFLTIPAIVLPLLVLLMLGTRSLPMGTRWQTWSVFGLGMSLTPFLLFALEAMAGILLFVGVVAFLIAQPELSSEFQALSQRIMIVGPQSEAARELLSPFLTKPGVIAIALLYTAVIVPAIEELLKPLGVWLLAGRLDSTAQGFTLGALSGAAYGLIETIGVSGQVGEWTTLLASRIGTGLLHITTSALMGAAIVLAWRERRYLRLMGSYLLAVLLHGLWNTSAMLYTFSTIAESLDQPGPLSGIQPTIITGMGVLAVTLVAILLISNRRMRKALPPAMPETNSLLEPTNQSLDENMS